MLLILSAPIDFMLPWSSRSFAQDSFFKGYKPIFFRKREK